MSDPKSRPTLEDILGEDAAQSKTKEQSPEEFSASMLRWAIRHGLEPDE